MFQHNFLHCFSQSPNSSNLEGKITALKQNNFFKVNFHCSYLSAVCVIVLQGRGASTRETGKLGVTSPILGQSGGWSSSGGSQGQTSGTHLWDSALYTVPVGLCGSWDQTKGSTHMIDHLGNLSHPLWYFLVLKIAYRILWGTEFPLAVPWRRCGAILKNSHLINNSGARNNSQGGSNIVSQHRCSSSH